MMQNKSNCRLTELKYFRKRYAGCSGRGVISSLLRCLVRHSRLAMVFATLWRTRTSGSPPSPSGPVASSPLYWLLLRHRLLLVLLLLLPFPPLICALHCVQLPTPTEFLVSNFQLERSNSNRCVAQPLVQPKKIRVLQTSPNGSIFFGKRQISSLCRPLCRQNYALCMMQTNLNGQDDDSSHHFARHANRSLSTQGTG